MCLTGRVRARGRRSDLPALSVAHAIGLRTVRAPGAGERAAICRGDRSGNDAAGLDRMALCRTTGATLDQGIIDRPCRPVWMVFQAERAGQS